MDNNVTRHIPEELKRNDWNTMVLHYLGLDHIGHKTGPRGYDLESVRCRAIVADGFKRPNMIPKQREMDGIVRQIYKAIEEETYLNSTLLVLCGDHGMNDAGNHGGSAPGETSPALVFVSPKLKTLSRGFQTPASFQENFQYYNTVEQSDIVPTLGALLGFPIPRNNLGSFIVDFLPIWSNKDDKLQILLRNAKQILHVVSATFSSFEFEGPSQKCHEVPDNVGELACQWRAIDASMPTELDDHVKDELLITLPQWLKRAQELMSSTASNYDVSKLVAGQIIVATALVLACTVAWRTLTQPFKAYYPLVLGSLLYGFMMFASSYVEEEQHFWYWASTAWLGMLWVKRYICLTKTTIHVKTYQYQFPKPCFSPHLPWICRYTCVSQNYPKVESNWPEMGRRARYFANVLLKS